MGASFGLLGDDLHERLMLGDTGANVIGAVLGLAVVLGSQEGTRIAVMLVLLALNVAAELVSFSAVIDRVPPLRWFDRLGVVANAPPAPSAPLITTSALRFREHGDGAERARSGSPRPPAASPRPSKLPKCCGDDTTTPHTSRAAAAFTSVRSVMRPCSMRWNDGSAKLPGGGVPGAPRQPRVRR